MQQHWQPAHSASIIGGFVAPKHNQQVCELTKASVAVFATLDFHRNIQTGPKVRVIVTGKPF